MNKEITKVLRGRLQADVGLEFIDVYSGLVQTVTRSIRDENDNPKTQRLPVSYDTNIVGCGISPEKALTPDSSKKGLVYFEENGNIIPDRRIAGGFTRYKSPLVLIAWLNRKRITGDTYEELTKIAVERIIAKLQEPGPDNGGFVNLKITTEWVKQDPSIFARYTYSEEVTQYLRPPFEFFAIGLTVTFFSRATCVPAIELNPNNC